MKAPAPANVDEYLTRIEWPEAKAALEHLRSLICQEAPKAEECISYGIPSYKLNGYLVGFAAFKNHCSFYPGHTVRDFSNELKGYKLAKGTIQFTPDKPLPDDLVCSIIRARIAESR